MQSMNAMKKSRFAADSKESAANLDFFNAEYERDEEIKICSGFLGYRQNPVTYSLSPVVGWFVVADNPNSDLLNHGTDHLIGISEDEADQDSDGLLYAHDSGNAHIKTSDDSDTGSDSEYVSKKKQKG